MPPSPAPQPERCGVGCWKLDGGVLGREGLLGEAGEE